MNEKTGDLGLYLNNSIHSILYRALRDSRDIALHDKEKVESNEKDLNRRLNELMNE